MKCRNELIGRHGVEFHFDTRRKGRDTAIVGQSEGPGERWQAQNVIDDELRLIGGGDNNNFVHGFVLASEGCRRSGFDQGRTTPQIAKNSFGLLTSMAKQQRRVLFVSL